MSNQSNGNSLRNINSKYILELIFNNLNQRKLLNIIRYSNKLQNELNKTIVDYYEEYSKMILLNFKDQKLKMPLLCLEISKT